MSIKKTLSASALALSFSFAGLATGASTALANADVAAEPAGGKDKGAEHKCG